MAEKKDHIAQVYEAFEKLADPAANPEQLESVYNVLLEAVKGDSKVKQLAAQFIPKFFAKFPKQADHALNALLDLCEDESIVIRKAAIPGLAELCKGSPKHTKQIADVLVQLLSSEDAGEAEKVKSTIAQLFSIDGKLVFETLIAHIPQADPLVREKEVKFLQEQIKLHFKDFANKETGADLQRLVLEGIIRKLLANDTIVGDQFQLFLRMLRLPYLRSFEKDDGLQLEVANIIASRSGVNGDFDPANVDAINALISCVKNARIVSKQGVDNSQYMAFFTQKVLPSLLQVPESNRLPLLVAFADASAHCSEATAKAALPYVYEALKEHIPTKDEPEAKAEMAAAADPESKAPAPAPITPAKTINFSLVEALLYIFHQLCAISPATAKEVAGLFTPTGQPSDFKPHLKERKAALVARLEHLNGSVTNFITQVNTVQKKLQEKRAASKTEEEKTTVKEKLAATRTALKTSTNVQKLTQGLLQKTPVFIKGGGAPASWKKGGPKKIDGDAKKPGSKKRAKSASSSSGAPHSTKRVKGGGNNNNTQAPSAAPRRGRGRGGKRGGGGGGNRHQGGNQGGDGSQSNAPSGGRRGRGGRGRRGRGRGHGRATASS